MTLPHQPKKPVTSDAWALQGITVEQAGDVVLRDVTIEVPQGAVTAVVGASGAGKSTLLRLLAGQSQPAQGIISGALSSHSFPTHGQGWQSGTGAARLAEIDHLLDQSAAALLLDEPTKAIAPDTTAAIHDRLLAAASDGMTIVLVTHEHRWVERTLSSAMLVTDGHCRNLATSDIDFLAIQHATMERLRADPPSTA